MADGHELCGLAFVEQTWSEHGECSRFGLSCFKGCSLFCYQYLLAG